METPSPYPCQLQEARARLGGLLRQPRPPAPAQSVTVLDARRRRCHHQRVVVAIWLRHIPSTARIAVLIGCTPRAVQDWRRGQRTPSAARLQKLRALWVCVHGAR
jgi:hypothetical protein